MNTIVICGFPGVGKSATTINNKYAENYCLDMESSLYKKAIEKENKDSFGLFPKNWVTAYVSDLEKILTEEPNKFRYIFMSCHKEVRNELRERGIKFITVIPNKECKREYRTRYLKRGDSIEFIDNIMNNWDYWIDNICSTEKRIILLEKGEYLSHVI
jgi:hypothetical protein